MSQKTDASFEPYVIRPPPGELLCMSSVMMGKSSPHIQY